MGMYVSLLELCPRILPDVHVVSQLIIRQDDPIIENGCYRI